MAVDLKQVFQNKVGCYQVLTEMSTKINIELKNKNENYTH